MVLNSAQAYAQLCCDVLERPLVRDHCGENVAFPFRESIRFAKGCKGLLGASRGSLFGGGWSGFSAVSWSGVSSVSADFLEYDEIRSP